MDIEDRAIGVKRAVERCNRLEGEPVLHGFAERVEAIGDEIGHGEDARAGVELIGAVSRGDVQSPRASARDRLALEDRNGAACTREAHCG